MNLKNVRRKVRKLQVEEKEREVVSTPTTMEEEDDHTTLDMTGWEDKVDLSSMRGLFFIQKGQFAKRGLCVTVRDGKEYDDRYIGGYDPYDDRTVEHYCVMDRVTFHTIYGGTSYDLAIKCLENCIHDYNNEPEMYFRQVCESTNEDFYFRHYEGAVRSSDSKLKKRAEEGRSWRSSPHTKRSGYAVYMKYGDYYKEDIEDAEERAVNRLQKEREERRKKKLHPKKRRVRKLLL